MYQVLFMPFHTSFLDVHLDKIVDQNHLGFGIILESGTAGFSQYHMSFIQVLLLLHDYSSVTYSVDNELMDIPTYNNYSR